MQLILVFQDVNIWVSDPDYSGCLLCARADVSAPAKGAKLSSATER